jgi:hypothetical protein
MSMVSRRESVVNVLIPTARCLALAALLCPVTACGDTGPATAPSPVVSPPAVSTPTPQAASLDTDWPRLSRPARVYTTVSPTTWSSHASPLASRFVLYEGGSFALQYSSSSHPFFQYLGTYSEAAGSLVFSWEGWSIAGPWGATGTITEETLAVKFNIVMSLSDFEDAVYVRAAP